MMHIYHLFILLHCHIFIMIKIFLPTFTLSYFYFIILSSKGAWIPIYPFDVIKTNIQNTQGDNTTRQYIIILYLPSKFHNNM